MTPTDVITKMMEISKWLDVFCEAGEDIYKEDFEIILALVGLATAGLIRPIETLGELGEKCANKYRKQEADEAVDELMKKLNIKKEGDDSIKPS